MIATSTSWPDAIVAVACIAGMVAFVWLLLR